MISIRWFVFSCMFTSMAGAALPTDGPTAQSNKKILFIASNLHNGGVRAISESFQDASTHLKWQVEVKDCAGKKSCVIPTLVQSIKHPPDGIILGGFDGADFRDTLKNAGKKNIKIVGWHAAAKPGPTNSMFMNVSTDPETVAKIATEQLEKFGPKSGGVIILTDRDYSVATAKTMAMKRAIEGMKNFKLIDVEDLALSTSEKEIVHVVRGWNQRYGKSWTHTVAINDNYFNVMEGALKKINRQDVIGIAAGDGSDEAMDRLKSPHSGQMVTVAEPLQTQGWQLADEMNRAFAGEPPSNYESEPIVVSKAYLNGLKSKDIEENIPFKKSYLEIWYPPKAKNTPP